MQTLPGFRDFYPADFAARAHVFARWREVARRYGFNEVDGPTLEPVELYLKKSGGELAGQLFDFTDRGERHVALRPEMTPTVARMIAARDRDFRKPVKWFSIAPFFRYEKPQKGRLREFTQLNCDLIGDASPAADAEMIALVIDLMRGLGLTQQDFFVRVNDRNAWTAFLEARGIAVERLAEFLTVIDKLERDRPEESTAKLLAFGVTLEEVRAFLARPVSASSPALGDIEADLRARGLAEFVEFDLTIVRGLAYYTGVVFEVFDRGRKSRALAGGGRYDELVGLLSDGAVRLPALGFAVGDVTLLDLLRELPHTAALLEDAVKASSTPEVYAIVADPNVRAQALGDIQKLRAAGVRVEFSTTPKNVRKEMGIASQCGAEFTVIYDGLWPRRKYKVMANRGSTGQDLESYCDSFEELLGALRPDPKRDREIDRNWDQAENTPPDGEG